MSLTVGELLSRPRLRLELIVAGDLDREIRWVHSTDMPDPAPYLQGDELILTAGIWYWHGTAPSSFAGSLGHASVAALGFGTNPLVEEVPAELVEACQGWGLTLFRVPPDVSFIEIAEEFVEIQHRLRERPLLQSLERSSRFVHALQVGDGLDGLLRVLSQLLPRAAAIIERRRGVISAVHPPETLPDAVDAIDAALANRAVSTDLDQLSVFAIPAASRDVALVVEGPEAGLSVSERTIIDQALAFVAVELQHQRAMSESERRFVGELFDLLGAGEAQLPTVRARLRSLGLDPDGYLCAIACAGGETEAVREAVMEYLASSGRAGAAAIKGANVAAVVQVQPGEDLPALVRELHAALGAGVFLGAGGLAEGASGLGRSALEASHACRLAQRRGDAGFATHDAIASHALLLGLQDDRLLDSFRETLIEPLEEHDRRRHTELVKTLDRFLGSGGRYQQTAEELHLHVNTLRLRLSRIEQLTGRDLGSMDDRVDLWIALRAREL